MDYKGAEATITKTKIIGIPAVVKDRVAKNYRAKELDTKLRKERTRVEARLLHKAKLAGVLCPTVLEVQEFKLVIEFLKGKRPKMNEKVAVGAGEILAKLHDAGIIHGDFTPANLLLVEGRSSKLEERRSTIYPPASSKVYVIDFGLGFFSVDVEDKAVDVLTMVKSIDRKLHESFLKGYANCKDYDKVMKRLEVVKKRVRYAF